MDHTFDTPDPIELYAEIGRGRVDITAADTDTTTVTVSGEHAEDVVVEQRDGQVAVVAPRSTGFLGGGGRRYLVTVTVPIGSALALKTGSADTAPEGEYGRRGPTPQRRPVRRAGDGSLEVQAGSGDEKITEVRDEGRIKSGSGESGSARSGRR